MKCLQCGQSTTNPKFCNKKCAAQYNNSRFPKRKPEGACQVCQIAIATDKTYCTRCKPIRGIQHYITIGEYRAAHTRSQFHTGLRMMARTSYLKTGRAYVCVCGYNLHVEICHICDIKDFEETTLLTVVSHPNNLVALCRNCHWEFDKGLRHIGAPRIEPG